MLKYLYAKEVCSEIPDEISLGISISGCLIRCPGCHSQELWEDKGTPLGLSMVDSLLKRHEGVTCLLILGGEHDMGYLMKIFSCFHKNIKTAWYCGLPKIKESNPIIRHLDYIKVGSYDKALGGLASPTTNQRLYQLEHQDDDRVRWKDITYRLQHEKSIEQGAS